MEDRPLRADAARNAERILRAARRCTPNSGPDAPMDVIASRAGVGERTLYRRFPTKGELARAVIDQSIAETLSPVIERATRSRNPLRGLTDLIEAAIALGAREHNALAAALKAGTLTDVSVQLEAALEDLTHAGSTGRPRPCRPGRRGSAAHGRDVATACSGRWIRRPTAGGDTSPDARCDIHAAARATAACGPDSIHKTLGGMADLMSELRFDGRVAVITGAGRGLGREYALLLASARRPRRGERPRRLCHRGWGGR